MSNLELSSRLIQKTKNNLSDVPDSDPGGEQPNKQTTGKQNRNEQNDEPNIGVPYHDHGECGHGGGLGKNSISLRRNEIERCITLLKHAMQCKNSSCEKKSCSKMKHLAIHIKRCRKHNHIETSSGTSSESCQLCKQFIAVCCYHAKRCDKSAC